MFTNLKVLARISRDQLPRYVLALRDVRFVLNHFHVTVRFPVPVSDMGVRTGRRCVRYPGRGHDTSGFAGPLSPLHDGRWSHVFGHRRRTVGQRHFRRYSDHAFVGLDTAQVSRGRTSRIGHLEINTIRLRKDDDVCK